MKTAKFKKNFLRKISNAAQLAAVLEVSIQKPGNIGPEHDFRDTRYEDFLSGAIAIGSAIEKSALMGFRAGMGEIPIREIKIGECIRNAIYDVKESHEGGNTHLGMLMLFVPIATGAGMCISKGIDFRKGLRESTNQIIKGSTIEDSKAFYKALKMAKAGGIKNLVEKEIAFYDLMKVSSKRDRISGELSNGMRIIFEFGVPTLEHFYQKHKRIGTIILQTYLKILSEFSDTFIAKKVGQEKADEISRRAKEVLDGKIDVQKFDQELRSEGNELNPGTTADLIAASLFVWLIYRIPTQTAGGGFAPPPPVLG